MSDFKFTPENCAYRNGLRPMAIGVAKNSPGFLTLYSIAPMPGGEAKLIWHYDDGKTNFDEGHELALLGEPQHTEAAQ